MRKRMKPCKRCGVNPVLETWNSGGLKCAVHCNNPNRENECDWKFYYTMSNNQEEAIKKWNDIN